MRILLAFVVACFLFIPAIVGAFHAQHHHQGKELGEAAIPCLCCLNIQTPYLGGMSLAIIFGGIVMVLFVLYVVDRYQQASDQKKWDDDRKKWPWLVNKRVKFKLEDNEVEGVVTQQQENRLWINYMNDYGILERHTRKVGEVTVKPSD